MFAIRMTQLLISNYQKSKYGHERHTKLPILKVTPGAEFGTDPNPNL